MLSLNAHVRFKRSAKRKPNAGERATSGSSSNFDFYIDNRCVKEVSAESGGGTKHPSILLGRLTRKVDNKIEAKIFVLHVGTWDERS